MGNLNVVQLIGRLGADPDLREVGKNDTPVVNISLATNRKYKSKDDNWVETTQWHNLTFWGRKAEILDEYCSSGSQIYVKGYLQTDEWEDDDENTRYTTKIVVEDLQLLDSPRQQDDKSSSKKKGKSKPPKGKGGKGKKQRQNEDEFYEDDIPF